MSESYSVFGLSLWKNSFEMVSRELELVKKRKQALHELLATATISQPTYETLSGELTDGLSYLESYRKSLIEKMKATASDVETQVSTLELFLANLEIHHAAGETEDESYSQQSDAITLGLEAAKNELIEIGSVLSTVTLPGETGKAGGAELEVPVKDEPAAAMVSPASSESEREVPEAASESTPETSLYPENQPF
ncbi:MAG: CdvA-like protein [Candidatus Bathyarchaeia archaeon]